MSLGCYEGVMRVLLYHHQFHLAHAEHCTHKAVTLPPSFSSHLFANPQLSRSCTLNSHSKPPIPGHEVPLRVYPERFKTFYTDPVYKGLPNETIDVSRPACAFQCPSNPLFAVLQPLVMA